MAPNPEHTKLDRLRIAVGAILAFGGVVALLFAAAGQFASLPLTLAGILFVLSGLLIAGSHRLAEHISGFLR